MDLLGDALPRLGLLDLLLRTGERDLFRDGTVAGENPLPPLSRSRLRSRERSARRSSREDAPPTTPLLGPPLSDGLSDLPEPARLRTGESDCLPGPPPGPRWPTPKALENGSPVAPRPEGLPGATEEEELNTWAFRAVVEVRPGPWDCGWEAGPGPWRPLDMT